MSSTVPVSMVNTFSGVVTHLYQQMTTRLRGTVREVPLEGEKNFFEFMGKVTPVKRSSRHQPTVHTEVEHTRRLVVFDDYLANEYTDTEDKLRLKIAPEGEYAKAFAYGINRTSDVVIAEAAVGTAFGGKDGTTPITLPSTQIVDVAFTKSGSSNSNLTVEKVRRASKILNANEVPLQDRYAAITASQWEALCEDEEFTSRDYNVFQPLASGLQMDIMWAGFRWRMTEHLPFKSANLRQTLFYHRDAIHMGVPQEPTFRIDQRTDMNYSWQTHCKFSVGAARMQEEGVVVVECDETV